MKPTPEQITQLFSTAAGLDEISGKQADFLALLEPDRVQAFSPEELSAEEFSDGELSDDELALAAGGQGPAPDKHTTNRANLIRPVRPRGL